MPRTRTRRSFSVCAAKGCPELSKERFCEHHAKQDERAHDARRPSATERGYDAQWQKTRRQYLKAYPTCQDEGGCIKQATDVDHIDGDPLGPRRYDWTNLRAFCHSHHSQRTARDQAGGFSMGTRATKPFIILVGESGTGKTTIAKHLGKLLNATPMGPDDFDVRWAGVYSLLDYTEKAIVECVRLPYGLQDRMADRGAFVVELLLDEAKRRQRLEGREIDQADVEQLMRPNRNKLGYDNAIEPDLVMDTDPGAAQVAKEIAVKAADHTVGIL